MSGELSDPLPSLAVCLWLDGDGDRELSELLEDPELDLAARFRRLLSGDRPGRDFTGLRRRGDMLRRRGDLLRGEGRLYRLGELRLLS